MNVAGKFTVYSHSGMIYTTDSIEVSEKHKDINTVLIPLGGIRFIDSESKEEVICTQYDIIKETNEVKEEK